ncbi:MAG TPA: hypothetical protein PLP72_26135, partial [Leptospiraceae bacterium]|nr:hypothetical protein [Leptospiraceae bacterium]HNF57891.1 hypothetical protein [Leptospiraceae bacterium]HNH03060.1 hypothetical protein [Leptospiraceae bacterium]HNM92244.1 hypothetical protein [Leptospiraceae bacterium]
MERGRLAREKAHTPMRQIAWYSGSYSVVIVVAILKKVFQYRIQYRKRIPNRSFHVSVHFKN